MGKSQKMDKIRIFTKFGKKRQFNWRFTEEKPRSLPMTRDFKKSGKNQQIDENNKNLHPLRVRAFSLELAPQGGVKKE